MNRRLRRALAVAAALGAPAAAARAQSASSTVTITAWVDVALSGIAVQDLGFGTATPGTSVTVTPGATAGCTGCTAGEWQMTSISNAKAANRKYIQLTFTSLPATLNQTDGTPLAVSWSNAAKACLEKNAAEYYCYPGWTPTQGAMHSVLINPDPSGQKGVRNMNVYLGGMIAPPSTQKAGVYHGLVTLQMAYGAF